MEQVFSIGENLSYSTLIERLKKCYSVRLVHGHCHGRIDDFNVKTGDLRVDVGIDGSLARECGGLIPFEKLNEHFCNIAQNDN
ncbi:hypothetical protein FACS189446_6410 [Bacteroidia bacterium]|nr:hypothetical protein FACS189446_6410 [Bacteroidia bacterium]